MRGISTRRNDHASGGGGHGMPGTVDEHERGQCRQLVGALPGGQTARCVGAEDEVARAVGITLSQLTKGVDHVAGPAALQLEVRGRHPGEAVDGRRDHGQAVLGGGDRPIGGLLPGVVGHHQQHLVEGEGVAHVHRGEEVSDVGRVEGAAQHAGSQSGTRHPSECRGDGKMGRSIPASAFMMEGDTPM